MMSNTAPYTVPREPGLWRAVALAVFVHAALLAFLWVGINWVNDKPETIVAEVWSTRELEQAPPPPVAPTPPPPEVVKPQPEVKEPPAVEKPDIALEEEKKRREKEKKAKEEAEEAKKEQAKQEEIEQKKKDLEEKQKQAKDKQKQDALDAKKIQKQREDELAHIKNQTSSMDGTGTAAHSQGNQSNSAWVGKVTAKVKSNIVGVTIPPSDNNDPVEFVVGLLPDGSIAGIRKTKSSGIPAFDDAVKRAIEASQPYPSDSSGRVPSSFTSINKPKDQ